ncbi:hypothetical protein AB7M49_008239 [Bradyrhizobium elkanii]|uniref:Uncharacterized protein n=1 Tax=Bradyrhizobium elkanii TaxID=29448 RepID=A0A8I1YEY1_BRAEL|nr:hypothetical protein [Bradyrhizobium elkanii]MBP1297374.1 hypothetical protein [Bradyrhizobium elkanii]MCP1969626.1 hypothetical protein [Bradyrhizobium elkanii]MCS4108867.1 hypothetical protein [Bradyrhizobium elkanii]
MYAIYGPYVLLAAVAVALLVAVNRDMISTIQFRIMMIGAAVLALAWSVFLGAVWREYG